MKKRINILFLIIIGIITFTFFDVDAKEIKNNNYISNTFEVSDYILVAANTCTKGVMTINCNEFEQEDKIFGCVCDEDSVSWLIDKVLNYLRILGPLIVLVFSSLDFAKAILTSDDESLNKAQKNLITRLILVAALFFLPDLIIVVLNVFGLSSGGINMFRWR